MTVILDPGHGMANRKAGVYDPGACAGGAKEAEIVMDWANELRGILMAKGHRVVRTRVDDKDPAPIGKRASIARQYGGEIMISLHCNCANGQASGAETFYRGEGNRAKAKRLNDIVVKGLETKDRGVKVEGQSQHGTLAVMNFQPCFLIELGFIDHAGDRQKLLDGEVRRKTCERLAEEIVAKSH